MRKKKAIVAMILAAGALGALAASGLGGAAGERSYSGATDFQIEDGGRAHHPGRQVSAPGRAGEQPTAQLARKGVKLRYRNSKYFTVKGQTATDLFWMKCRRGYKAVNGYLGSKGPGLVLTNSDPSRNARKWYFGLINLNSTAAVRYYTGIVCVK